MGQRPQWPESRTPPIMMPGLDSVSGKSFGQASQTVGALGGRRAKEEWFVRDSVAAPNRKIVKTTGGIWRLVRATARVRIAPTLGAVTVDLLARVPGAPSPVSVFDTPLTIAVGETEAVGGIVDPAYKMLPIGTLVSMDVGTAVSGMMVAVFDYGNTKTATLRYESGIWVKRSEDAAAWLTLALHHFPDMGNIIFRCRASSGSYDNWAALQRSIDLGIGWSDTTVLGCPDAVHAPNGDLYAIGTGADGQPHRIYRSTTNGLTWVQVFNDTAGDPSFTVYRRIVVDPMDSDHVIAVGWDSSAGNQQVFLRSTDATLGVGATYTRTEPSMTATAEKNDMAFCFGQGGRLVWAYEDSSGTQVLVDTSDNDGVSWTSRLIHASAGNAPPNAMFLSGTYIYMYHAATDGIMRSPDNGLAWNSFTGLPIAANIRGLEVDADDGVLYSGQNDAPEADTILKMDPIALGGSWTDISAGLLAATGFSDVQLCDGGLALLAGGSVGAYDLTTELHYRVRAVAQ